jgi:hypothetical protein
VRLSAVIAQNGTVVVACGVTKNQFGPQHVALTLGQKAATAYLWVAYILQLDAEQRYLAVAKSDFTVSRTADRERVLFHYDYAREPSNEYPAAHVQVAGESKDWATLTEARGQTGKPLKDFHFPVGGRRYRPILEDVIEFSSTISALNSGVNDLRGRGFLRSVISILDILSGAVPLMVDVRQTGGSPRR